MEYKVKIDQKDLLLSINKNYDKSIINLEKWAYYLDRLCGNREYQKEAIKTAVIYLASGMYQNIEELVESNYNDNSELQKKYTTIDEYLSNLQIKNKLFANIDLATGTGKSYVMYGIAQILLSENIVKRVLVLCPSLTIEAGLTEKFSYLSTDSALNSAIPEECSVKNPRLISADSTIIEGDICIENIHAVYDSTGSSIKDSFKAGGEDTLVLNDESHHIFNNIKGSTETAKHIRKWKEFLINPEYNFSYILGFTGTAYIDSEYFNDVIFRYSLREAIDDKVVKSIDYVQKDDTGSNVNYKFQKMKSNHDDNKRKYPKIKPLSIMVTSDIKSAKMLHEDFVDFLMESENISRIVAENKVLIVTSDNSHKINISKLKYSDDKENEIEWIISVSMLTEGWDVKNIFQIIPWEDRAFNSKLLISQVLGRGLRLPLEYNNPQPSVVVFNHDSWSKNIKSLVDEILEIETRIISTVDYEGERNKYNFKLKNLNYDRKFEEIITPSFGREINYENVWEDGIKLKSQVVSSEKETEYENLLTGSRQNVNYDIKLKTKTVDDVVNKVLREFALRDWETIIIGLGKEVYSKDDLPPREIIKTVIEKSMRNVGIEGNELIEENCQKIYSAFSTLFRERNKTVISVVESTDFVIVDTLSIPNETKGLSSFRHDSTLFHTDRYIEECLGSDQQKTVKKFINDGSFRKDATVEVNFFQFKTPLNYVFSTASPEREFIKKYLCNYENAEKIEAWIKSRDMGFYSIEYSYKINTHTKQAKFNPDFIIKQNINDEDVFIVVEIKGDKDVSLENKGKNKASLEHFKRINKKLTELNINEKYYFHFLSPVDYDAFFKHIRDKNIDKFRSDLDILLDE